MAKWRKRSKNEIKNAKIICIKIQLHKNSEKPDLQFKVNVETKYRGNEYRRATADTTPVRKRATISSAA